MPTLDDPFYYLVNFQTVLDWVEDRSGDLLSREEHAFIDEFRRAPRPARALLVRLVMRRGERFRLSRLRYPEIGEVDPALSPLLEPGWVARDPVLSLEELAALLTRAEWLALFGAHLSTRGGRKSELVAALAQALDDPSPRSWSDWLATGDAAPPLAGDMLVALKLRDLCDRLRLLFFGNLRQDWSEFVLSDLGLFCYEAVPFSPDARAFQQRAEVDAWLHMHRCRQALEDGSRSPQECLADLPGVFDRNPWLESRRGRLLFAIARQLERTGNPGAAVPLYLESGHREARIRALRVMARTGREADALTLALELQDHPRVEAEQQVAARVICALQKKLALTITSAPHGRQPPGLRIDLPAEAGAESVERLARDFLQHPDAPVHYVENALLNSLFGLLCWDVIFAPLPGAFFHPFQSGPADLFRPDFVARRSTLFKTRLGQLEDGSYRDTIRERYRSSQGVQSTFVHWGLLEEPLLEQALHCLPARHLRLFFDRMLADLQANRAGLPDLVQFWPARQCYRLIEVKGPGDRLQDNQRRWLEFCRRHDIPTTVCHVRYTAAESSPTAAAGARP